MVSIYSLVLNGLFMEELAIRWHSLDDCTVFGSRHSDVAVHASWLKRFQTWTSPATFEDVSELFQQAASQLSRFGQRAETLDKNLLNPFGRIREC